MTKLEQIYMFQELEKQTTTKKMEDEKLKRKWENAFQKWSNDQALSGIHSYGACGYSCICDYCIENDYGRPCVRALNAMCRELNIQIDYTVKNFEKIWDGR